jgi:hypothetical protein
MPVPVNRLKRRQIKGFSLKPTRPLSASRMTAPRPSTLRKRSNSAIGHWHRALLQLFLIVNQEIDQWRAAP